MSIYESTGTSDFFSESHDVNDKLRKLKLALSTIPPTSMENERAFSAAGTFTTKLRTRLKPETFDTLCFLRAHLQNK